MDDEMLRRLRTQEELIYCTAASKLMVLTTTKGQMDLVKHIYASVLDLYGFEGVFTLFYTLATAIKISDGQVLPPGPDAPVGDHLGYQLTRLMVASDFQAAWELFEREYIEPDPTDEVVMGTLSYLINTVGCIALAQAQRLSEQE